ncbi:MAG: F0F1 ATP synthase subunit A [Pirellulaceae bacterium]|nr:F0F1 ATP synthase subunit A [Pirellulaceae bacterium]
MLDANEITKQSIESASMGEKIEGGMAYHLSPAHLFDHVQDAKYFEVPAFLGSKWSIPQLPFANEEGMFSLAGLPIFRFQITKFMLLELLAAVMVLVAFVWLARRSASSTRPQGKRANILEVFVLFVRDEIAKPAIGSHDAHRFLPFLLTLFFFILALNLIGMVPMLGSVTSAISVTAAFALLTFVVVVSSGMKKMGVVGFLKAQAPHMDLPAALKIIIVPGIWLIEMFGLFIKHFVLAVRLFANMFAGHLVLAAFVALIGAVSTTYLVWGVAPVAVVAGIAISVLELFVAFLQAYVFTFLAALFIGSAQHAH